MLESSLNNFHNSEKKSDGYLLTFVGTEQLRVHSLAVSDVASEDTDDAEDDLVLYSSSSSGSVSSLNLFCSIRFGVILCC